MKINAIMERKAPKIQTDSYSVDDVIVLSEEEYSSLYNDLLEDREYFEKRKDAGEYLLVLGEGKRNGILVNTEGYSYARYSALVPFARQLVDEHIKKLTDYAINEARKAKGRKEKIPYEAIRNVSEQD